ncbi:hypothetical protein SERLA73DRAFT_156419 [Serpula lacrymans var. lacrymans S7.3]|uniref:DNA 3'-5' helicase n=1 Tax=Serpula lacrymans var. lacrymans (strain S7.3) TaxID=936435 RepID=F8QED6_SERL3|nr:hypothetical protein SERLA73DRAFT_156419 [Serpula lacrymans var. lacrymans S7.3]
MPLTPDVSICPKCEGKNSRDHQWDRHSKTALIECSFGIFKIERTFDTLMCPIRGCNEERERIRTMRKHLSVAHGALTDNSDHSPAVVALRADDTRTSVVGTVLRQGKVVKKGLAVGQSVADESEDVAAEEQNLELVNSDDEKSILGDPEYHSSANFFEDTIKKLEHRKRAKVAQGPQNASEELDDEVSQLLTEAQAIPDPDTNDCKFGVLAKDAHSHLSYSHHLEVDKDNILEALRPLQPIDDAHDMPFIAPNGPPLEIIPVVDGYQCTLQCTFCSFKKGTCERHVYHHPREQRNSGIDNLRNARVQTVFQGRNRKYFAINEALASPLSEELPLEEILRNYESIFNMVGPSSPNTLREVPPLLQITQWHVLLREYVEDEEKRKQLMTIMGLEEPECQFAYTHMRKASIKYLNEAANRVRQGGLGIRCLIKHGPNVSSTNTDHFHTLLTDSSVDTYTEVLASYITFLFRTYTGFGDQAIALPTNPQQEDMISEFIHSLKNQAEEVPFPHDILFSMMGPNDSAEEGDTFQCPLLRYIALGSLKADGTFIEAEWLTGKLAKWKYIIKCCVVMQSDLHKEESTFRREILANYDTHLSIGSGCPFNFISELQSAASSIAKLTVHIPQVFWDEQFTKLSISGEVLYMSKLRSGLQEMMQTASYIMKELTEGVKYLTRLPEDVKDNFANKDYGFLWLSGGPFTDRPQPLVTDVLQSTKWNLCRKDNAGRICWNIPTACSILSKCAMLNEVLSVLNHIVPSQPCRGTEWVDMKIRNSMRTQNHYNLMSSMYWIVRYTKITSILGHNNYIPLLCPSTLRDLNMEYFVVVRPLEVFLTSLVYGESAVRLFQEYAWVQMGKRVSSEQFSVYLSTHIRVFCDASLLVNNWRNCAVSIMRQFIEPHYYMGGDRIGDLASGHGTYMSRNRYGLEPNGIPQLTTDAMHEFAKLDRQWHDILGFGVNPPPIAIVFLPRNGGNSQNTKDDLLGKDWCQKFAQALTQRVVEDLRATRQKDITKGAALALGQAICSKFDVSSFSSDCSIEDVLNAIYERGHKERLKDMKQAVELALSKRKRGVEEDEDEEANGPKKKSRSEDSNSNDSEVVVVDAVVEDALPPSSILPPSSLPPPRSLAPVLERSQSAMEPSFAPRRAELVSGKKKSIVQDVPSDVNRLFDSDVEVVEGLPSTPSVDRTPGRSRQVYIIILKVPDVASECDIIHSDDDLSGDSLFGGLDSEEEDNSHLTSSPSSSTDFATKQVLQVLRLLHGPDARPRSNGQAELIHHALANQRDLFVRLKCGAGKASTWLACGKVELDKVTAVVIPYRSLLGQHMEEANRMRVKSARWTQSEWEKRPEQYQDDDIHLLFLPMEALKTSHFHIFRRESKVGRRVRRLILDEYHEYFVNEELRQPDPVFLQVQQFEFQKIAMTATAPPRLETRWKRVLGWGQHIYTISEETDRLDIRHSIVQFPGGNTLGKWRMRAVGRLIKHLEGTLAPGEAILVYTMSCDEADKLGEQFQMARHHNKLPASSPNSKSEFLCMWMEGHYKTMVATCGLTAGMNHMRVAAEATVVEGSQTLS